MVKVSIANINLLRDVHGDAVAAEFFEDIEKNA
jgi:hypothetical protein